MPESKPWQSSIATRYALLAVIVLSLAGLSLLWDVRYPIPRLIAMGLASAALLYLVWLEYHDRQLTTGIVIGAIVIATVVAIIPPPMESRDAWQYTMYGRMVSEYGESPYTNKPIDFAADPLFKQLSSRWYKTPSVYGPVFTWTSAGITAVAGDSALASRLGFQLLATLAFAAILVLAWRTTRSIPILLFLGLNPIFIVHGVNAAHNDVLVGLALLAGVLLVARGHWWWAGAAFGLGAGVKLTALVGVAFICVWLWRHRSFGAAVATGVATAVVTVGPYLAFGGKDALSGLSANSKLMSHGALWRIIPRIGLGEIPVRLTLVLALAAVAAFGFYACFRFRLEMAAWIPLAVYCLVAAYVLPWYIIWVLPLIGLTLLAQSSRLIAAYTLAFAALYQMFWKTEYIGAAGALRTAFGFLVPLLTGAVVVALVYAVRADVRSGVMAPDDGDEHSVAAESDAALTPSAG